MNEWRTVNQSIGARRGGRGRDTDDDEALPRGWGVGEYSKLDWVWIIVSALVSLALLGLGAATLVTTAELKPMLALVDTIHANTRPDAAAAPQAHVTASSTSPWTTQVLSGGGLAARWEKVQGADWCGASGTGTSNVASWVSSDSFASMSTWSFRLIYWTDMARSYVVGLPRLYSCHSSSPTVNAVPQCWPCSKWGWETDEGVFCQTNPLPVNDSVDTCMLLPPGPNVNGYCNKGWHKWQTILELQKYTPVICGTFCATYYPGTATYFVVGKGGHATNVYCQCFKLCTPTPSASTTAKSDVYKLVS